MAPHSAAFAALHVDETGLDAIAALGYEEPTPIQSATIELLYDGADVVGLAQTGTGKTIAFGL
ncbi:MAG: DEAD/DEAH box helicase, partial [Tepidiformaceae bacterium]